MQSPYPTRAIGPGVGPNGLSASRDLQTRPMLPEELIAAQVGTRLTAWDWQIH